MFHHRAVLVSSILFLENFLLIQLPPARIKWFNSEINLRYLVSIQQQQQIHFKPSNKIGSLKMELLVFDQRIDFYFSLSSKSNGRQLKTSEEMFLLFQMSSN